MKVLHLLSGGIDSTYVMWKWMKENPRERLLVQHTVLKTPDKRASNRWEKECEAVANILVWFRSNGFKNFRYLESVLDVRQIDPLVMDSTMNGFIAGLVLTKYPMIKLILNNTPKDEVLRLGERLDIVTAKAKRVRDITAGRSVAVEKVLINTTKKEIIQAMPPDLLALCWYCRKPTPEGGPCGKCHTCIQVRRAYEDNIQTKTR